MLPPQTLPSVPDPQNFTYGSQECPEKKQDFHHYQGFYPLMWNMCRFYKPADSLDMRAASYNYRYLKIPNSNIIIDSIKPIAMTVWSNLFYGANALEGIDDFLNRLLPRQRLRCIEDMKLYNAGTSFDKIQMSTKTDELLLQKQGSQSTFIARGLFNMSGHWLILLGRFVAVMTDALASHCNKYGDGRFVYGGQRYVFFFTCGAVSSDLDHFMSLAEADTSDTIWAMFMGDDIGGKKHKYLESDFSKFDRTQNYDLMSVLRDWLDDAGYGKYASIWYNMCITPMKNFHRKTQTTLPVWYGMEGKYTGEPTTCYSNSMFNMAASAWALSASTPEAVIQRYSDFGFTAKYKEVDKHMTFLKGVFLRNIVGGLTWVRLPSFIGKAFKIMTDWRYLKYPKQYNDIQKRMYMVYAQWRGYGTMDSNWFYTQLDRIIRNRASQILDHCLSEVIPSELSKYHITATARPEVLDEVWNTFMFDRYNITVEEQKQFLTVFENAPIGTTIISDNVEFMNKLLSTDY